MVTKVRQITLHLCFVERYGYAMPPHPRCTFSVVSLFIKSFYLGLMLAAYSQQSTWSDLVWNSHHFITVLKMPSSFPFYSEWNQRYELCTSWQYFINSNKELRILIPNLNNQNSFLPSAMFLLRRLWVLPFVTSRARNDGACVSPTRLSPCSGSCMLWFTRIAPHILMATFCPELF